MQPQRLKLLGLRRVKQGRFGIHGNLFKHNSNSKVKHYNSQCKKSSRPNFELFDPTLGYKIFIKIKIEYYKFVKT